MIPGGGGTSTPEETDRKQEVSQSMGVEESEPGTSEVRESKSEESKPGEREAGESKPGVSEPGEREAEENISGESDSEEQEAEVGDLGEQEVEESVSEERIPGEIVSVEEKVSTAPVSSVDIPSQSKSEKEFVSEPASESADESAGGSADEISEERVHICSFTSVETAATCLEEGKIQEICLECKQVAGSRAIPALGHDFKRSIWESPTCLKGGYYNNTCERCGLVECVTEAALPHEPEDVLIQEGNCMEDTIIRHICRHCGQQTQKDTRYTPAIHEWTKGVVDGTEITYCKLCGVTQ